MKIQQKTKSTPAKNQPKIMPNVAEKPAVNRKPTQEATPGTVEKTINHLN